jgi:hypothetical protein
MGNQGCPLQAASGQGNKTSVASRLCCMEFAPFFLFYEYQPRPYPFALLSLALRIGAGIKHCHRGFTIYLQPFAIAGFK